MPEIRGWLRMMHRGFRIYCGLWHQLRTEGYAPLPETGPAILISNHTCGIDHMLLQAGSRRLLGFMIAREYYESRWLHWICSFIGCIPVNRDGRDVAAIRAALRALGEGRVLPIFPEGRILPASGRQLGEMRPGSAYIAIRAGVPVVPAYIIGTPRTDEIVESLVTPSRARVFFGDPIDLSDIPPDLAGDKAVQADVSAVPAGPPGAPGAGRRGRGRRGLIDCLIAGSVISWRGIPGECSRSTSRRRSAAPAGSAGRGSGGTDRSRGRWCSAPGRPMARAARTSSRSIAGSSLPATWDSSRRRSPIDRGGRSRTTTGDSGS